MLVRLSGEFDADSVHVLRQALTAACDCRMIVDCTDVAFADSALLHALLDARRRLILAGPLPTQPHRLFDSTGTTPLFTRTRDVQSAHRLCGS